MLVALIPNKLQGNQKRYMELLQNINEGIPIRPAITSNVTEKYMEVNDAACDLLGYTRYQILQMCPKTIMGQDKAYSLSAYMETLQSEGNAQFETELIYENGNKIPVEISAHLFQFKGEPTCIALVRDISAKMEIENAIRKSE